MIRNKTKNMLLAGALAAVTAVWANAALTTAATAAPRSNAAADLALSVGRGRLITLPRPMVDVFVANDKVADVQVRSSTQLYVFAKTPGETSVYATDAAGRVVYSSVIRVANNLETLDQMLGLAMPDANISINSMNGFVLLTGTVASPEDAAEADRLVQAMVGDGTKVISRIQTATPLQVNLQVRFAEVNRTLIKDIGVSLINSPQIDPVTGRPRKNPYFSTYSGNDSAMHKDKDGFIDGFMKASNGTSIGFGGRILGQVLNAQLDLAESNGLVATLAQPNLTAMSGETADFLAGGEFPVPMPDPGGNSTLIVFKKFGVSLSYTPTVLSNGRISLRVRPEVSELSTEGALQINGYAVPSLTVRRTETTVELGSGESFMIAGLMNNKSIGQLGKAPGLGDIPILGNLFKSDSFRRGETELVIMITPYLVKPVSADQIKLPTDAFKSPTDIQRVLMNQNADGNSGQARPMPTIENRTVPAGNVLPHANAADANRRTRQPASNESGPGFSMK